MARHSALRTRMFAALMLVLAACGAALFAHVAIDAAGDVLLAHDTYDGLDHHSRGEVVAFGLTVVVGVLLRLCWLALDEARTGQARTRVSFDEIFGPTAWRFLVAVALLALPILMAMESLDVVSSGGRVDDPTDLLGGSALLGVSLTLGAGIAVAGAVRQIARSLMQSHRVLVAVFGRLIVLLTQPGASGLRRSFRRDDRPAFQRRSILSRRRGKRGPPLPVR